MMQDEEGWILTSISDITSNDTLNGNANKLLLISKQWHFQHLSDTQQSFDIK